MNWRAIWAIVEKDLKIVLQSKSVAIPLIAIPLLIAGILPLILGITLRDVDPLSLQRIISVLPPSLIEQMADLTPSQTLLSYVLIYFFAPLYLILPVMVSNVIAADSFAGERERKTLEALLYTPTSDSDLLTAKLLAAWLPGIGISLISFVLYASIANTVAWPVMERLLLPNLMWLILVFWVAPAAAGLGLGTSVFVSARVNSLQSAYQIGSLIVVPVMGLIIGQITGTLYLDVSMVCLMGLVLWVIDAGLLWYGQLTFRRSVLVARL